MIDGIPEPTDEQLERFRLAVTVTRKLEINLTAGIERRLKAWTHRTNADLQRAGYSADLFDPDDDIVFALLAAAEAGLHQAEQEAGVEYDPITGQPTFAVTTT